MTKYISALVLIYGLLLQTAQAESLLLKNARIITASDAGTLSKGDVLITDGIVSRVDTSIKASGEVRVIDYSGQVISPGFINPESALGIREINGGANASESASNDKQITAAYNVADIINPYSVAIPVARRGGVTGAIIAPSSSRDSHYAGQAAWFTTEDSASPESVVPAKAIFWDLKAVSSGRGATFPRLRAELQDAIAYANNGDSAGPFKAKNWSRYDLKALAPVMRGEIPMAFRVNRATDITALIKILADTNIKAILVGAAEGWMVASQIAESGIPVVADPTDNLPSNFDMINAANQNILSMHEAGVKVIIGGPTSAHDAGKIRYFAGIAVGNGLPYDEAIKAISAIPAEVFGLARIGQIKQGMRADIAVWDGDPLEPLSQLTALYIQGKPQSLLTRQDLLEQRYINEAVNVYRKTGTKGE
ncbi:MAG: amidohydrolase family protein [Alteromonadaceae bacterium]|nr:amidohydrolase family protein [Alteromonadaceae bacterium]